MIDVFVNGGVASNTVINVATPSLEITSGTKPLVFAVVTPRSAELNGVSGRAPLTSNAGGPELSEANRSLQARHALTHPSEIALAPVVVVPLTMGIEVSVSDGSEGSTEVTVGKGLGETISEETGSGTSGVNVGMGVSDSSGGKEGSGVMELDFTATV